MGLYTQRKQGIDGSRTSKLEADALSDRYFMMRVRIDGGALTTEQPRVVGAISTEFARGSADISDRQNVQLQWIRIEDVPEIWRRLDADGGAEGQTSELQPIMRHSSADYCQKKK